MRSSLVGIVFVLGCGSPEFQQQKVADGSWKVTCELSMDECVRRAQEACPNQRYRILEGTSETRLRDAPPFERAYHTSRLHLKCTSDGTDALLSLGSSGVPSAAPSSAPVAPPSRACAIGETRTCVGAGACQGGQACLPEGTGFGACDCGPVAAGATPTAPSPTTPLPVAAPAAPPASAAPAGPAPSPR